MFLHFHNGICDKQDASSEGQKGESHLVHSQGCMVDAETLPAKLLQAGWHLSGCLGF